MVQCLTVNSHQMEIILPALIHMGICCFLDLDAVNTMKRLVYLIVVKIVIFDSIIHTSYLKLYG